MQSSESLFRTLRKIGCPPTISTILQQFPTDMCAQVVLGGHQSSSFPVEVRVKHGSVLAPIIFSLFLVAMILVSQRDLQSSDCVEIEYRLDGSLFNLRRIQAKTKASSAGFLPFSTPSMQPFLALLLRDFKVVLMSCLRLTSVLAL